jgi:hypothetical protein
MPATRISVPGVITRAQLQKENDIRTVSSKSTDVSFNICILCALWSNRGLFKRCFSRKAAVV